MAYRKPQKPQRVYVKVRSDFDATGYMQPRFIIWPDGRVFRIDAIRDFYPAGAGNPGVTGHSWSVSTSDRYTVIIQGEQRYLYFERSRPGFVSTVGRWFVEVAGGTA